MSPDKFVIFVAIDMNLKTTSAFSELRSTDLVGVNIKFHHIISFKIYL